MKITSIELGTAIPFKAVTHEYGRAEFVVCPVFRRSIMRELYLTPRQQPAYFGEMFSVNLEDMRIWSLSLSGYPKEADPYVWNTAWCKEHKCYALCLYVAPRAKSLTPVPHFGDNITLEFR